MAGINFTINGIAVEAQKGETILNAARRAGIYIPTMCYLTKTKPIASCRLCVVEVEGVDGFILSCQTPPTEGIAVKTDSSELYEHRQNIMKLYDVNHPLECGVCDKSGACDLQNKTMEFDVAQQTFTAKEQKRPIKHWGLINYDPNLCILCEKCTHVCNEVIGDDAIELYFGGYSSHVKPKGTEELSCTNCGECIAVCPVGALVSSDFQYRANAWELKPVPATCAHCSGGCALYYETRHAGIGKPGETMIYRVSNEYELTTLCGAGRFGFDFENRVEGKDEAAFNRAIEAFKKADTIAFTSQITNEEAQILQTLKERFGYRLVNPEAANYQKFLEAYAAISGEQLYKGTFDALARSEVVLVLGSRILTDNPAVRYHITTASRRNNARVIYLHPLEDAQMRNVATQFIKYEVGTEEGVLALLAQQLLADRTDAKTGRILQGLDTGYLSAESNIGEEEIALIQKAMRRKSRFSLIVGEDCYSHARSENIARLAALFERYGGFNVIAVSPKTNSLGVSLICDLDDKAGSYTVGYNTTGDFVLSALGGGDLAMPALNQQEGTFTSVDKRVVPTHVALPFGGYVLNDIANVLGVKARYTIEYTRKLPEEKGYRVIDFDAIDYRFDMQHGETRGYFLQSIDVETDGTVEEVANLPEYNGGVIYNCNPVLQFGQFTVKAHQLADEQPVLSGSSQFAAAVKLEDGAVLMMDVGGEKLQRVFRIDRELKGTIALNPTYDSGLSENLLSSIYRYQPAKFEVIGTTNE